MTDIGSNRLGQEASAYLRQHADNPVHWQPWEKSVLDAAKELDRPILLSIGYSACHWCHVMAHESFEDEETAAVMNALFVNIKVDREERPDIDQIYMAALSAMGQQGGWPLTMFLQPDGKPFWGGTYFPPTSRHNLPGFRDVLYAVHNLWKNDKEKINHNSRAVFDHLDTKLAGQNLALANDSSRFEAIAENVYRLFDQVKGGITGAPKFPNAPFMEMLWLSWLYDGRETHRNTFLHSLKTMLQGGIYDHLGGGLCRYSTDAEWLVPHFEKMLYDNAQLLRHANWAYSETHDELFRIRIEETVNWLLREMQLSNHCFASGLDADSEGVEGKFYVWSAREIDQILGSETEEFKAYFGTTENGNWEGHNILNRLHAVDQSSALPESIEQSRQKMMAAREQRARPGRDGKALTDWNGYAIRGLVEAGKSLSHPDWIDAAAAAYSSIKSTVKDGRLTHCRMEEVYVYPALSTDYASMINATLALFEATGSRDYLDDATNLKQALDLWHRDEFGNYRLTAKDADDVIIRPYGDYDEAIPSATSQIIEALTRLATATTDLNLSQELETIVSQALGRTQNQQYGQIGILNAARVAYDPYSLVLADNSEDQKLISIANQYPDPRRLDIKLKVIAGEEVTLPAGGSAKLSEGESAAWLCKGNMCLPPVYTPDALEELLSHKQKHRVTE